MLVSISLVAILPYMGYPATLADAEWANVFEELYRCPADNQTSIESSLRC
jgi:hypothetical protein